MRKTSTIFKTTTWGFVLLFLITTSMMSAQTDDHRFSPEQFNLPPGAVFYPKTFVETDYEYKLYDSSLNEPLEKNYMYEFSQEDLNILRTKYPSDNQYYIDAVAYFDSLSNNVKRKFTVDELWYIYKFDNYLKNKLKTIN